MKKSKKITTLASRRNEQVSKWPSETKDFKYSIKLISTLYLLIYES